MQDLNLEWKPDETMRICRTPDCGEILEGKQIYCKKCYRWRKLKSIQKANKKRSMEPETFPTWKCDQCNEVLQLDFNPAGISYRNIKFDKFKAKHYSKCKNVLPKKEMDNRSEGYVQGQSL
ncbi:hypothetical protein M0R04_10790 [Candidatus Dojkabacteria bacterium]|jgi:hypothetical protein|nr:hypothetical protein [Candidatus Dojkabacteria bacterium]